MTGFHDLKVSYYMAFRDWNNGIGEDSKTAPSTFSPSLGYTENLPEVTILFEKWGGANFLFGFA